MSKQHLYTSTIVWTGDRGQGTADYRGYDRTWEVRTPGKPIIRCSNDPLLGGDPALPNRADLAHADAIHQQVHQYCFIARSVSFPVVCAATYSEA